MTQILADLKKPHQRRTVKTEKHIEPTPVIIFSGKDFCQPSPKSMVAIIPQSAEFCDDKMCQFDNHKNHYRIGLYLPGSPFIMAVFPSFRALLLIAKTFIVCSSFLIPIVLFIPVQCGDLCHFLIGQLEAEQIKVFPDMVGVAGTGDDHNASLEVPP